LQMQKNEEFYKDYGISSI